ncbi:NAD(P)H-binding protein [Luteipulveratus mongoliensis]|uniref:Oxidoreductase n=1 Tax=Luteipulveratus mongoliensis TaxID=571913 RepID=A0A0K1JL02_9MICO|nr:NAD(P)H-binding protein [Luteipulveratus mongoliensis]AKU17253.1 oxidoreductase [Luteipulveratus mongoliensis]
MTRRVLVTGVTGYLGSRLVVPLLESGWDVRVLARTPAKLDRHPWRSQVEVVQGDATDTDTVEAAMQDVAVAYYLLHSMDGAGDLADRDHEMAKTFADAAAAAGVERIVYLGGLHPAGQDLSEHLASRADVGQVFLDGEVPAVVLQAAILIGSGSASFEMLRHLTHRLPVMLTPRWVRSRIQPIAIDDVLHYLVGAADLPSTVNRTFDVGGPDVLTYQQMIEGFADVAGLHRRLVLIAPVLTPQLASLWVGLVTPVPSSIARPLVDSLVHDVVCGEHDIDQWVPAPEGGATSYTEAVRRALTPREDLSPPPAASVWPGDPDWVG